MASSFCRPACTRCTSVAIVVAPTFWYWVCTWDAVVGEANIPATAADVVLSTYAVTASLRSSA